MSFSYSRLLLQPVKALLRQTKVFSLCLLLSLFFFLPSFGQEEQAVRFSVSTQATAGTGAFAPFWLTANHHGLASTACSSGYIRAAAIRPFSNNKKGFEWAYGADVAAACHHTSAFIVQQCYADLRYNVWQLTIGSKEHAAQGKHPRLSTGGMTWSGNASPIPQVRFGIEDYAPVPYTKGWAAVKGFVSYGQMTDNRFQRTFVSNATYALYTQDALFHEKSAFLRLGDTSRHPLTVEMGVEMDCMFGGTLWEHDARNGSTDTEHKLFDNPQTASDFFKALVPLNGGESSTLSDQRNAAGNHFGSLHAALSWEDNDWRIRGYYEHYFESRCGMTPWNAFRDMNGALHNGFPYPWKDGLFGIEITLPRNPVASTIVAEYNTTRDQCGSIHHGASSNLPATIYGFACYYYNSSYPSWHHNGFTAGSPLLYSPLYNSETNHTLIITNTRIRAYHIGIEGRPLPILAHRLLGTWERSWGSYIDPLPEPGNTFSALAEATWTPARSLSWLTSATAAFALDRSDIIGHNTGFSLTLQKDF